MNFLFPDCIIIHYKHNHIIKLVKFSRRGGGGGGGSCPAALRAVYSPVIMFDFKTLFAIIFIIISDEVRYGFLFGGPTVDIQNNWRPIATAQRFSMAHPKSLRPTLAVTL
jgi:hypothetical protein